jgi:hypothetical protein
MESKIRHQIRINKIKDMKYPTILMNDKDFDSLRKEVKSKVPSIIIGENPTFEGIPIKARSYIEKGRVIVLDSIFNDLRNHPLNK